jgi:zinc protease
MKSMLTAAAIISAAALAAAAPPPPNPAAGGAEKAFPFKMESKVLENGLQLHAIHYDSPGLVAYYTVVRTGSRNEVEAGHTGFAHFFEHMMFRGTEKYSAERYNEIVKEIGAD